MNRKRSMDDDEFEKGHAPMSQPPKSLEATTLDIQSTESTRPSRRPLLTLLVIVIVIAIIAGLYLRTRSNA